MTVSILTRPVKASATDAYQSFDSHASYKDILCISPKKGEWT